MPLCWTNAYGCYAIRPHVDVDGLLTCPIRPSIEDVMSAQTSAVSGATPRPLLLYGVVPRQRPTQIVISPSSHLLLRCS
jgi:hypothetical protein